MQITWNAISASRASFASGSSDMLITDPPHDRYKFDSARVENWGPSVHRAS